MDQQTKQAINQARNSIWFDLETTGRGQIDNKGPILKKPVGVWQMGVSSDEFSDLFYGKSDIPFEKEAAALFGDEVGKITGTEEDLVKHFGKLITEKPNAVLSGFNIGKFDIPVMLQAFQRYGMDKEAQILKGMTVNDVQLTASKFLDAVLTDTAKSKLGLSFKDNRVLGTKLENIGEALGVIERKGDGFVFADTGRQFRAHYAPDDVTLTKMVHSVLQNPTEAGKKFSVKRWIESVDRSHPEKLKTWQAAHLQNLRNHNIDLYNEVNILTDDSYSIDLQKVEAVAEVVAKKEPIKPITKAAAEVVDNTLSQVPKVINKLKELKPSSRTIKWGLAGLGAIAALKIAQSFKPKEKDTSDYISASSLGRSEQDLKRTIENSRNFSSYNKSSNSYDSSLKLSQYTQDIIEKELNNSSISFESDVAVQDDELGIKGIVNSVVKVDGKQIPIEVRAISSRGVDNIAEPERSHASQANFYAHALQAPGSYVMYVSNEDKDVRKTFYVPYSPGTLIRDVADFRSVLLSNNVPEKLSEWAKQSETYWEGYQPSASAGYGKYNSSSKTRDQRSKYNHLFPLGQNDNVNHQNNGSRQYPRN